MTTPIGVTVKRDGEGYSAFLVNEDASLTRISPTWLRDTFIEKPTELKVPLPEKGRFGKVTRMVPHKTGQRVKLGESRAAATNRAVYALKCIALGKVDDIEIPKAKHAHE